MMIYQVFYNYMMRVVKNIHVHRENEKFVAGSFMEKEVVNTNDKEFYMELLQTNLFHNSYDDIVEHLKKLD